MKKILVVILLITALGIPSVAMAYENIVYHTEKNSDYSAAFTVYNVSTQDCKFYKGYKLSDYKLISSFGWYQEILVSTQLEWSNPDYLIVSGKQSVPMVLTINKEKITLNFTFDVDTNTKLSLNGGFSQTAYYCTVGDKEDIVAQDAKFYHDGKQVLGSIVFTNWDSSKVGSYEFEWTFIPNDKDIYDKKSGVITCYFKQDPDKLITTTPSVTPISSTPTPTPKPIPSLSVSTLYLEDIGTYKIELTTNPEDATYEWSSSNRKIARVNASTGYVTAVKTGKANITCKITYADASTQTLVCKVIVGEKNAPYLNKSTLTLKIGDTFDINVLNKIKKSKYRFDVKDSSVIKVNAITGKVTALGQGKTYILCTMKAPGNKVVVLRCDIKVIKEKIKEK